MKKNINEKNFKVDGKMPTMQDILNKGKDIFIKCSKDELIRLAGNIKSMFGIVKAYYKKEYTKIPKNTLGAIIFALGYLLSPVDVIPDTLPGGYVDDAFVITTVLSGVNKDLEEFEEWENSKKAA